MRKYSYLLVFFCCWTHWLWAAKLPLEFVSLPVITDMEPNQSQTLTYVIHNNLPTQYLPLRSITVINGGDQQPPSTAAIASTCGTFIAPNAYCSIIVTLGNLVPGRFYRHLVIDYNGRAPLVSSIAFNVTQAKYTILMYIVGSDLESLGQSASFNINQMATVGSSKEMKVVLETGGANAPGWLTVQRKIVLPGSAVTLQDLGPVNMAAASTIQDFIQWGMTNFPADNYILIFNDHGGGPNGGFGGDELYNNAATPINQLVAAIRGATLNTGKRFEMIGFDACLMASAELLAGLAPYTNYFVASEDLEPGQGWQYNTFLAYVKNNLLANGLAIGIDIINGYTSQNEGDSTTLSIAASSEVANLIAAISNFANALNSHVRSVSEWKAIANARYKSADYSTSIWEANSFDVVDLTAFATAVAAQFPADPVLQLATNAVVSTNANTIKYLLNSANRADSNGLTVYFPSILGQYDPDYPSNTKLNGQEFFSTNYVSLVQDYYQFYSANTSSLVANPTNLQYDGTTYTATITNDYNELFAAVGNDACPFSVFDRRNNLLSSPPCYTSIQYQGIDAVAGVSNTWNISFVKADHVDEWPLINDEPMLLIPDDATPSMPGEDTFIIPVTMSDAGYSTGFLSVVKNANGTYEVVGFQKSVGSSNTAAKITDIENGTQFFLRTYAFDGSRWLLLRTDVAITSPFTISFGSVSAPAFTNFRFLVGDRTGNLTITDDSKPY